LSTATAMSGNALVTLNWLNATSTANVINQADNLVRYRLMFTPWTAAGNFLPRRWRGKFYTSSRYSARLRQR
jgi:hypothetical protein